LLLKSSVGVVKSLDSCMKGVCSFQCVSLYRNVEADVDCYMTRCPSEKFAVLLTRDELDGWLADF